MTNIIVDLLESPPWVIITFMVVYTFIIVIIVWKVSSWYKGFSGWNKHRVSEKTWKEKVSRLEKDNEELREKLNQDSDKNS